MDAAGVPCSPVNTLDTVLSLPQVLYREMVVETPRADIPDLRLPGIALKLDDTPGSVRLPPPSLGQHTDSVLTDLGYDGAAIAALHEAGVV
jgi:crotonobetainyl-CoA:carnitine CoA-transferase CaiB-like acyl-CoA transferase